MPGTVARPDFPHEWFPLPVRLFLIERHGDHPGTAIYPSSGDVWTAQQAKYLVSDNSAQERAELPTLLSVPEAAERL